MRFIAALSLALLLTACAAHGQGGTNRPVKIGQTAWVNGLRARPDAVIADSRCPAKMLCVWAGELVIRATVWGGAWSRKIKLKLNEPVPMADGMLTLIGVRPAKPSDGDITTKDYRFTFDFKGGL